VTPIEMKRMRHSLGVSQEEFAHMLGITLATYSKWELGKRKPCRMGMRLLDAFEEKMDEVTEEKVRRQRKAEKYAKADPPANG
jgi:putative transcriptional regulator